MRPLGDLATGAAEDVGVEKVVGDERGRSGVVLGAPLRRDPVAHLRIEPGALQRHVGQDGHHVDHEGITLRAVQRIAPRLVDEREEVPGDVDGVGVASRRPRGAVHHPKQLAQPGDRLGRPGDVAVALLAGDDHHRRAVPGDIDRNAVHGREHGLQRRQAGLARGHAFPLPEGSESLDGAHRARRGVVGRVRDPHLAEPERERRAQAEADPAGRHLVEGAHGHRDEHGVTRERVERAEADAQLGDLRRDRARVGDGIALEVAVVEPDRVETGGAGALRPGDAVGDLAT